jgi:hypothetical protein
MISEGELLQANVTIIAGILIFLTLAPISRGIVYEIVVRKYILDIVIYAIILFAGSMLSLLFPYELRIFSLKFPSFIIAGMLFMFGIGFVVGLVLGLRKLLPQIVKQQKGEDKG